LAIRTRAFAHHSLDVRNVAMIPELVHFVAMNSSISWSKSASSTSHFRPKSISFRRCRIVHHCRIREHEDNDMMRPFTAIAEPSMPRALAASASPG
jgi:hypothetical protein